MGEHDDRRHHGEPARVPPHNLEMEESLLGAMMLSREALRASTDARLEPRDFYKPGHGIIFEAAHALHANDSPVDPVTLAEELRRRGQLDKIGGRAQLLHIQAGTPASANSAHYAAVIAELAMLRRVIEAASSIQAMAYRIDSDDDLAALQLATLQMSNVALRADIDKRVGPIDLGPILDGTPPEITPTMWARTDGRPLLYPGRLHQFATEPTQGKTWLALWLCAEQMRADRDCVYVDLEADGPTMVERLRALDVTDTTIRERFVYVRLEQRLTVGDRQSLVALIQHHDAAICVIDTFAALLAANGLDEDSNSQVLSFLVPVIRPLAQAGAAVLLLDHVTKKQDDRGRWARGAGAKLGEVDAAYSLQTLEPFSRQRSGKLRVRLDKDRYGAIGTEKEIVAQIDIAVADEGRHVTLTTTAPPVPAGDGDFRPTNAMVAVNDILQAAAGVPMSASAIEDATTGYRKQTVRQALDALVRGGWVRRGPNTGRRGFAYRLVRAYQPDMTPPSDQPVDDLGLDF